MIPGLRTFREALRDLGYVEAQNVLIEERYADGKAERLWNLAVELVGLKTGVIVTPGSSATRAAERATTVVPIVFVSGDPIAQGFVTRRCSQ